MNNIAPIIITGMHRSGTSLLSNILMKQGVFMGSKLDSNNESIFFQRINKWILSCIGSSWDNPQTLKDLDNEDINVIINRLGKALNSRFSKSLFLGKKDLIYNKSLNEIDIVWGWKDPVNTFTLFIWKQIFPNSKIININRHPLDVSTSLINRESNLKSKDKESLFPEFLSSLLPVLSINKGDVLSSFNIKNINDGLKLYKKYFDEIESNKNLYDVLDIKYEYLIMDSNKVLNEIFDYLDMNISDDEYQDIERILDKSRVYAFKNNKLDFDDKLLELIDY
tara:strand:+ start:27101 stop:27940 length:840 start_codon:yes stop_codon:yes gene_type:complete